MQGLIMNREYLEDILNGNKKNDVRTYPTFNRGVIALIDSAKSEIIGLVELIECKEITCAEYISWHQTGKYKNVEFVGSQEGKYYSYELINPTRLAQPIKIIKKGKVWVKIDEKISNEFFVQNTLF